MFQLVIPQMNMLNIMKLSTPYSATLSALIFNAIIIPSLIHIAMKGVKYKPMRSERMLLRNMGIYGAGGVIVPFIGIKLIDMLVSPLLAALGLFPQIYSRHTVPDWIRTLRFRAPGYRMAPSQRHRDWRRMS